MLFLKFLFDRLREQKIRLIGLALLMSIVVLAEGLIITLLVPLLSLIFKEGNTGEGTIGRIVTIIAEILRVCHISISLTNILVLIVVMVIFQSLLSLTSAHFMMKTLTNFEYSLIHNLFKEFSFSSWTYFLKKQAGELVNVLSVETDRATTAFQFTIYFISDSFFIILYTILAGIISWKISLIGFIGFGGIIFILKRFIQKSEKYGSGTTKLNNELQAYAFDKLSAMKFIKYSATENKVLAGIDWLTKQKIRLRYLSMMNGGMIPAIYQSMTMLFLSCGIYLGVSYFKVDFGKILLLLFIFYRISPRFSAIQKNYQQAILYIPALNEVYKVLNEAKREFEHSGDIKKESFDSKIVLDKVSFAYKNDLFVLNNIDLVIQKGESIAIVGESGVGKSTLIDLLLGLFHPTRGQILVDGIPLRNYDLGSWRRLIGYLSQDVFLFNDTILNNLTWIQNTSIEQVKEAAKIAYADKFIMEMPEGYNTVIGDRGVKLSGGQRQRLALARVILQDPEILILDEATNALDSESEAKIQEAIKKVFANKTMITISHRFSTVRNVERIYVLEGGIIVEVGTWNELVNQGGRFNQLRGI